MSIRFLCEACRTTLKIESMISQQKKVRCTKCSIVILIDPDPGSPTGIKASIPDQTGKGTLKSKAEEARQRKIVFTAAGLVGAFVVLAIGWNLLPPGNRGAVEGYVSLDGQKVESGKITFTGIDNATIEATADIVDGHYRLSRYSGPALGSNKVRITVMRPNGKQIDKIGGRPGEKIDELEDAVALDYGAESKQTRDIKPGANTYDFSVPSKDGPSHPPFAPTP